ncbi:MBL fold metallo-hydrolase [Brevibacillus sp. SYSU BS000544]|uniref:MBL fold metallo-hydrolase n=1 Tax=Brevibacillus sp. SYSU BS000544 TaxID=3416443 RepID=UPI003CE468F6
MSNGPTMISEKVGYFPGSVNVGVVIGQSGVILIDSGLDTQTAKKIKKGLDAIAQPVRAIVQTHSHADHFGGNSYLLSVFEEAICYAPPLEEAIIRNPILEPIYLGIGASVLPELKNKFLCAEPSRVDNILPVEGEIEIDGVTFTILSLPGHSWQQVGIVVDDICFAADSYFGQTTLTKHKLPFLVDASETIASLKKLQETRYQGYLPGHGEFETSVQETIQANIRCHEEIMEWIEQIFIKQEMTLEDGLAMLCEQLAVEIDNLTKFVLYRTAFMGYLVGLYREKRLSYRFKGNQMIWAKAETSE